MEKSINNGNGTGVKTFLVGLVLCGACCAFPLLGMIGGTTLVSGLALYFEGITVALVVAGAGILIIRYFVKKRACNCTIDCDCKSNADPKQFS